MTGKQVMGYVDKLLDTHETRWKKREKGSAIRELEKEVGRTHVGSIELNNVMKVSADIYAAPEKWQYHIKIKYSINGKRKSTKVHLDMNDVESSTDINQAIQTALIKDLAKMISVETFNQNKKVIAAATKEFVG